MNAVVALKRKPSRPIDPDDPEHYIERLLCCPEFLEEALSEHPGRFYELAAQHDWIAAGRELIHAGYRYIDDQIQMQRNRSEGLEGTWALSAICEIFGAPTDGVRGVPFPPPK